MSAFIWRDRLALIGIPIRLALAIVTLLVADIQQAPLHILALTLIVAIGSLIATLGVVTDRWGVLIADGARNIQGSTWLLVFPALFLTATLFCLNFIGDGLRDALDPRDR